MDIPYIPYFTTSRYRVQAMIDLANVKPGERAADLGTGDGRIAIALAKAGAIVDAYELDDQRIKEAKENIKNNFPVIPDVILNPVVIGSETKQSHLYSHPELISGSDIIPPTILKKDFWYQDLSNYSIICCYPMPDIMGRLEHKLQQELKPGSRVLLNYFPFTHWKLEKTKDNIYLYKK